MSRERAEEVAARIDEKFWGLPLGTDQQDASDFLIEWVAAAIEAEVQRAVALYKEEFDEAAHALTQAGIPTRHPDGADISLPTRVEILAEQAQRAVAEEREACARLAEARVFRTNSPDLVSQVASTIAAAIRARQSTGGKE
jgi:hypothetical protein